MAERAGSGWRKRLVTAALCLLAGCGLRAGAHAHPGEPVGVDLAPTAVASGPPWPWVTEMTGDVAGPARAELAQSPLWKAIVAVWAEADEIAQGKKGPHPFDEAGKRRILGALEEACKSASELARQGLLSEAEARPVERDMRTLIIRVAGYRPTEMRLATCYAPRMLTPGRDSFKRLSERLPLLEKLAASGRVHPEVVNKIAVGIEQDLAVIVKGKSFTGMTPQEIDEAKKVASQVRRRLEQVKKKSRADRRADTAAWNGPEEGPTA